MTREQKIEALHKHKLPHGESSRWIYEAGILAGIALRDEELLAMEFDEDKFNEWFLEASHDCNGEHISMPSNTDCARWQHEQFMKAIKGDGDA